jgi:hypothetical protein
MSKHDGSIETFVRGSAVWPAGITAGPHATPPGTDKRQTGMTAGSLMHSGVWGCIGPNREEAPTLVCLTVPSLPARLRFLAAAWTALAPL